MPDKTRKQFQFIRILINMLSDVHFPKQTLSLPQLKRSMYEKFNVCFFFTFFFNRASRHVVLSWLNWLGSARLGSIWSQTKIDSLTINNCGLFGLCERIIRRIVCAYSNFTVAVELLCCWYYTVFADIGAGANDFPDVF